MFIPIAKRSDIPLGHRWRHRALGESEGKLLKGNCYRNVGWGRSERRQVAMAASGGSGAADVRSERCHALA